MKKAMQLTYAGDRNMYSGSRVAQAFSATAFSLLVGLSAQPAMAADTPDAQVLKKLEALEKEMDALKAQLRANTTAIANAPQKTGSGPEVSFGGQYRINSYSVDNDVSGEGSQNASRARIRQNVDIKFDEQFKTHLQMELGHTTDNIDTTNNSTRGNNLAVRHAVMDYTTKSGINLQAGIVPLGDYFGDTLFSSDWNYNPVALSAIAPVGVGKLRAFASSLKKKSETNTNTNDLAHYQLDYVLPLAGKNQINLGGSFVRAGDPAAIQRNHSNLGLGGQVEVGRGLMVNAFILASRTDKDLLATGVGNGSGTAVKLELAGGAGPGKFGLLATHASGKSDGTGFLPTQALAKTNGYWGYTGILTIQGPTDTGFDGDSVNISNNGYGLSTVQAKYAFPITQDLSGYVAAGWFGNTKTPTGRSSDVGTDYLLMGNYRFNKFLALDFGAAVAKLKDGVSGYSKGVIGGATFNQGEGVNRNKRALFTRLQAEF